MGHLDGVKPGEFSLEEQQTELLDLIVRGSKSLNVVKLQSCTVLWDDRWELSPVSWYHMV